MTACWASPNDVDCRFNVSSAFDRPIHGVSQDKNLERAHSGGLLPGFGFDQHSHNVALFHYEVLDAIDLDLGARPLAEEDAVADPNVDGDKLAALVAAARSNGDDLALLRLLLCGIRNDDAAGGLRLGINTLDDDAVVKRAKFH